MVERTIHLTEEANSRLDTYLQKRGQDLESFLSCVVEEPAEFVGSDEFYDRVSDSIDRSLEDIKEGRVYDARESMREIAKKHGLKLNR